MRKILIFTILFLGSISTINAKQERLVNEINDITLNNSQDELIVEGWGFIMNAQNYYNSQTHSYTLKLNSKNHSFSVRGRIRPISQTDTMFYVGRRYCENNEYFKNSTECNNHYDNVGFSFHIPLELFKMEENYKVSLVVHANTANVTQSTEVFFPNKNIIKLTNDHDHYIIDSKLHDIGAKVLNSWVIVRKEPHKESSYYKSELNCSSDNTLYFKQNALFKSIYDKKFNNNTTYYALKGTNTHCDGAMSVVQEGNDLNPVWIASTFIEHVGEILTIKTRRINTKPILNVGDNIILYVNETYDPLEGVSAYDEEDGDLTQHINIVSNTYENKVGTYRIVYSVTDSFNDTVFASKNITVLRKNHPPQIIAEDVTLQRYSPYNPLDYAKAYDQNKVDISDRLENRSNVDTSLLKTQRQCYSVRDSYNLTSFKCILVHIKDNQSRFRFIQIKRPFYREEVPKNWKMNEERLNNEINNEIIYDSFSLHK